MLEFILLYTKAEDGSGECPFCEKAKAWLRDKQIPFLVSALVPADRSLLYDRYELVDPYRTVPQAIFVDSEGEHTRIGSYSELVESGIESLFHAEAITAALKKSSTDAVLETVAPPSL